MSSSSTLPRVNRHQNLDRYGNPTENDENNIKSLDNVDQKKSKQNMTSNTFNANTLPRGPYLQYKYNEKHETIITLRNCPTVSAHTHIDNSRQKQIEQLKREFSIFSKPVAIIEADKENKVVDEVKYLHKKSDDSFQNINKSAYSPNSKKPASIRIESFDKKIDQFSMDMFENTKDTNCINNADESIGMVEILRKCYDENPSIDTHPDKLHKSNEMGKSKLKRTKNCDIPSFVYLSDAMKVKSNGLDQCEGWALLCQSVQALQDLFISSKFSLFNKIFGIVFFTFSSNFLAQILHQ